jgi:hypothetical protein
MVKLNDLQKHEIADWSDEVEEILKTLSEKAQIWRILHLKNHSIFKRKYYCLIVPVTILSSITGAANLALGSVASGNETVINLVIGALGIIISVISTLNNIFSFQKRKDEHYRASKEWYRVQRIIDIELSLQRSKRNNVSTFFHLVLQEIERIHEFHPNIREDVIHTFMKKYKNKKLSIDIPEILLIKRTIIFKDSPSYIHKQINKTKNEEKNVKENEEKNVKENEEKNVKENVEKNVKENVEKNVKENVEKNKVDIDDNNLEIIIENSNKETNNEFKLQKQNTFIDMNDKDINEKNSSISSKLGGILKYVPNIFYNKNENKNSSSEINESKSVTSDLEISNKSNSNSKINTIPNANNLYKPENVISTETPTPVEQSEKNNEYENNYHFNIYDSNEFAQKDIISSRIFNEKKN